MDYAPRVLLILILLVFVLMVAECSRENRMEAECIRKGGEPVYMHRQGVVCFAKGTLVP